jgi:hypothetical protein
MHAGRSPEKRLGGWGLEGARENVLSLPFLCNILRILAGKIERTLDFGGFPLARNVLRKPHTRTKNYVSCQLPELDFCRPHFFDYTVSAPMRPNLRRNTE